MQSRVDPDVRSDDGRTPLSWATIKEYEAIIRLLLAQKSVDPDAKSGDSRTPLFLDAEEGHETIVRLLLAQKDIDPNVRRYDRSTPLFIAAEEGHAAIVRLLLAQRVSILTQRATMGQRRYHSLLKRDIRGLSAYLGIAQDGTNLYTMGVIIKSCTKWR
jgi:ankyrin repeat protein